MGEFFVLILFFYLICHIPGIVLLVLGLKRAETRPENSKKLLIAAGIYFLIGGGICGAFLS